MSRFTVDMRHVNDAMHAKFAARLKALYAPSLGAMPQLATPEQVDQHFALLVRHAASEGFARRNQTVKYAFIATHLGMFFPFDPLLEEMRRTALWQQDGVHPLVGLNRMFDHVDLMITEGLIPRNTGFAPGLLEACALPDTLPPAQAITRAAPKRAHALGQKALDRAIAAATEQCAPNGPLADCAPRDCAIACHFLGHGFWLDPLYHWVHDVLARQGLSGLKGKLDA